MNQDITLLIGILLLLTLGAVVGWYLSERWYSKKLFIILEECKKLNTATIALWQDLLKHKKRNTRDQDNLPK